MKSAASIARATMTLISVATVVVLGSITDIRPTESQVSPSAPALGEEGVLLGDRADRGLPI
jgi:hypothetical protein